MIKRKIKLVLFEEPKIKLCSDQNIVHFVDFYKINNRGYGIEHSLLKEIRTIQDVLREVQGIGYTRNKPDEPGKVICGLKKILLFDNSFLQNVNRIKKPN